MKFLVHVRVLDLLVSQWPSTSATKCRKTSSSLWIIFSASHRQVPRCLHSWVACQVRWVTSQRLLRKWVNSKSVSPQHRRVPLHPYRRSTFPQTTSLTPHPQQHSRILTQRSCSHARSHHLVSILPSTHSSHHHKHS